MRTFSIQTLGCKVNQYESEQIATLLRARGLTASHSLEQADLRVINTCSVTIQAASKSRQTVRRSTRLQVLQNLPSLDLPSSSPPSGVPPEDGGDERGRTVKPRVVVTGCWATSDRAEVERLDGVDAVLDHHNDVAAQLNRLLDHWLLPENDGLPDESRMAKPSSPPEYLRGESQKWKSFAPALEPITSNKTQGLEAVKKNPETGSQSLPLLGDQRQSSHQRALLKVQDGCDAHCTYCIIPKLRTRLWSKPVEVVVDEARRLVDCGHVELVLTGIFLGAYGQPTAIRKRQPSQENSPLAELITTLCTQVPSLLRLRFSSLEPGDLTPELISVMKSHPQVVPHFHLPLQSGSDFILRKMNRQYTSGDYLRMIEHVRQAFDRPAITTDIIVGFPGETDAAFGETLDIVERVKFVHIHAFSFSPRPGTAAARWEGDFIHGPIVNERINLLNARASDHSFEFRRQFAGQMAQLLVERPKKFDTLRHGRSERYFDVHFDDPSAQTGDAVRVRIDRVTHGRTFGKVVS